MAKGARRATSGMSKAAVVAARAFIETLSPWIPLDAAPIAGWIPFAAVPNFPVEVAVTFACVESFLRSLVALPTESDFTFITREVVSAICLGGKEIAI